MLDFFYAPSSVGSYASLIKFVADRSRLDFRSAINMKNCLQNVTGIPHTLEDILRETVLWYLDNRAWGKNVLSGGYRSWLQINYAGR